MGLRCLVNQCPIIVFALLACVIAGCSDAVSLMRETEAGGVVTYVFKEERGGPMGSPHRKEALKVMEKKCPSGYTVIKDGEVSSNGYMSDMEGEVTGRRWGIQFRCK